jgi:hypothetical protein
MARAAKPVRLRALAFVVAHLGVAEDPDGSNRGPLIDKWNELAGVPFGSAWCLSTIHAAYHYCGVELGGGASVGNFEAWAKAQGWLIGRPRRGDVGCLDWNSDSWPDHAVIVERVLALRYRGGRFVGWIQYVAGNDGNAVRRRRLWVPATSRFARVPG